MQERVENHCIREQVIGQAIKMYVVKQLYI